jgi:hypothetical protein
MNEIYQFVDIKYVLTVSRSLLLYKSATVHITYKLFRSYLPNARLRQFAHKWPQKI